MSKKKYRSSMEIMYDLISAAKGSTNKTHLMYDSSLSFGQFRRYLNILLDQGLIVEQSEDIEDSKVYHVSSKGLEYLTLVDRLQSFIDIKSNHEEPAIVSAAPLPKTNWKH